MSGDPRRRKEHNAMDEMTGARVSRTGYRWAALVMSTGFMIAACGGSENASDVPTTPAEAAATVVDPPSSEPAATTPPETTPPDTAAPDTTPSDTTPPTSEPATDVECRPVSFPSQGSELPGERCDPLGVTQDAPVPAVVVLKGCGYSAGDPLLLEQGLATSIAAAGMTALIVDYHAAAPPSTPEAYCQPSEETIAAVPAMLAAVTDAAAWLRGDALVDDSAVGAVGYSLGGLWALYAHLGEVALASVPPAEFDAIATLAPALFPDVLDAARAGRMPPLYVIHGELDDVNSVDDSEALVQAAQAGGTDATFVPRQGMDHGWGEPSAATERAEATIEITDFLSTHLDPSD